MTDQDAPDERPARQQLRDALAPLLPRTWVWVTDERARPDDERTRVHLLQRTIDPSSWGGKPSHRLGFEVTVTVPQPDLSAAEDQLDDDVLALLYALASLKGLQWTTATKATYDGRLGYQFGLTIPSSRRNDA